MFKHSKVQHLLNRNASCHQLDDVSRANNHVRVPSIALRSNTHATFHKIQLSFDTLLISLLTKLSSHLNTSTKTAVKYLFG